MSTGTTALVRRVFGRRSIYLTGLLLLIISIVAPIPVLAQEPIGIEHFMISVPANGTREIPINGYCLDRGLPFPGSQLTPVELAPDEVRVAIAHIVEQDHMSQDLWQTQLAIWHLLDGQHPAGEDHDFADEIIEFAQSGVQPLDASAPVMTLRQAIEQELVSASIDDFANASPPTYFYFGDGTLVVTNLTDQPQIMAIPYGMRFTDGTQTNVQDMGIFPSPEAEPDPVELPSAGGSVPLDMLTALSLMGTGLGSLVVGRALRRRSAV